MIIQKMKANRMVGANEKHHFRVVTPGQEGCFPPPLPVTRGDYT